MKSLKERLKNLDGQNKEGSKKGKRVRNQSNIFVSSETCHMKSLICI